MTRAWLLAIATAAATTGCWTWGDDEGGFVGNGGPPAVGNRGPVIFDPQVPSWPPLGPDHQVLVGMEARDGARLDRAQYRFLNEVLHTLSGDFMTDAVTGAELGEGYGTLEVEVWDNSGTSSEVSVLDLLVDLSPPEIFPGETILRHGADVDLELYVADAWVLGGVEISIDGVNRSHWFEPGWPATLGTDWDMSLVQFPTGDFPEGEHVAVIVASDAAGNEQVVTLDLRFDGTPPSASIVHPAPGTTVSGLFDVSVSGDDGGLPVWLTISIGGTPLATAAGPDATVLLDAADLTPGATTLEVVAMDQAGNVSSSASIPLLVE